jgi:hypothetical protein
VANSAVDIGWRLDRLNISRFHWRVLALIAAGMFSIPSIFIWLAAFSARWFKLANRRLL